MFDKLIEWAIDYRYHLMALSALGGVCLLLYRFAHEHFRFGESIRSTRLHRTMERAQGAPSFTRSEIKRALQDYIEPNCSQEDPSNETDLRKVAEVRESVMQVVDRFVARGGEHRHILLLADSGMGKTTFALNYLEKQTRKKDAFGCVVLPLSRPNIIEQIARIDSPSEKILILDAFDEDADAIEGKNSRIQELMSASADFAAVILTCRSQFFLNDAAIPNETGVSVIGPKRAGEAGSYKFYRLYLLPFSEGQITAYLNKTFPIWSFVRRGEARRLIKDIPELSVRPMLLALIPELARTRRNVRELYDLYEFMIDQWLTRESRWIDKEKLLDVSKRLAVYMFCNETGRTKDRVSLAELHAISSANSEEDDLKHLTARSLLNRDSSGLYKFAHRSIAEYLFVVAAISGESSCFSHPWTNFMREVFVSWGTTHTSPAQIERAREILQLDLRKSQLLPLSAPLPGPRVISPIDLLKNFTSERRDIKRRRPVPAAWRLTNLRYTKSNNVLHLFDLDYNLAWKVVQTMELGRREDVEIYKHNTADLNRRLKNSWRLPSSSELMSLLEAERTLNIGTLIDPGHFYWIGDRLSKGRLIVASLSDLAADERLRPLDYRIKEQIIPVKLHEIRRPNKFGEQRPFSAMCITVTEGAEALWYSHNEAREHDAEPRIRV